MLEIETKSLLPKCKVKQYSNGLEFKHYNRRVVVLRDKSNNVFNFIFKKKLPKDFNFELCADCNPNGKCCKIERGIRTVFLKLSEQAAESVLIALAKELWGAEITENGIIFKGKEK